MSDDDELSAATVTTDFHVWPHKCAVTGKRLKALTFNKRVQTQRMIAMGAMVSTHAWISNKGYVILKLQGKV